MNKCPTCWGTGKELDHYKMGQKVRAARLKAGLQIKEVALQIGITDSMLCYMELGKRRWTRESYALALDICST